MAYLNRMKEKLIKKTKGREGGREIEKKTEATPETVRCEIMKLCVFRRKKIRCSSYLAYAFFNREKIDFHKQN